MAASGWYREQAEPGTTESFPFPFSLALAARSYSGLVMLLLSKHNEDDTLFGKERKWGVVCVHDLAGFQLHRWAMTWGKV